MAKKITETGPVGLKGIRNSDLYGKLSSMAQSGDEDAKVLLSGLSVGKHRPFDANDSAEGYFTPVQHEYKTPYATLGESKYDAPYITGSDPTDVNEMRYNNQPWYDTLANGVGKMFGKAATTFASSLVGLPYGIMQAINEGRASALWDNDVTQTLSDIDKWMEKNMTNYQSREQQQDPTFRFGDMNWWADNFITNVGFTLGAAGAMAVGGGGLGLLGRSLGLVNNVSKATKGGAAFLSSLLSATGEGMIEAKQGVEERNKIKFQELDDSYAEQRAALEEEIREMQQEYEATKGLYMVRGADGSYIDPADEKRRQRTAELQLKSKELQQSYNTAKQEIIESGQKMGNAILGLNQALLTAGNLIQFGKGVVKGFDSARHAAEISSKTAKPLGVWTKTLADGTMKVQGKNLARGIAATKGFFTEGSEEMNQQWIQSGAGAYYNKKNINDYWIAKNDLESGKSVAEGTYTLGEAISKGFQDSWGSYDQYEQFLIGAMTGAGGIYMPNKIFNQDRTKSKFNPLRYGTWEGGALRELNDANKEYAQYSENIDDFNKILKSEDFPERVKNFIGHTFTQSQKDAAAENDDKKAWKDADDKQMIHDIQAFLRAGKLNNLKAIFDEIGSNLSNNDIDNIIKNTTREVSEEEDKKNFDNKVNAQIAEHQKRIAELEQRAKDIGDAQDVLEGSERADYQTAVRSSVEDIFAQVDKEYDAINKLEQEKQNYTPQKYQDGVYVDADGNYKYSYDEIREQIKHNSEELNRKLNSYLDSVKYVNKVTKGQLTKDQEDNLVYLHNLGKESDVRMRKIMANVRKSLPKTLLLKTSKTPKQLTEEYAISDLVFKKSDKTKEGYVEVDTSLMDDDAFANFFQKDVLRGGNINPEFAETADEKAIKEEENLSEEEKKKREKNRVSKKVQDALKKAEKEAQEQWDTNWRNIVENFFATYQANKNSSIEEVAEAFKVVAQDIKDAVKLYDQAGEFYKTLREYMSNPSKVDKDKAEAEEKSEKEVKKQEVKKNLTGKSSKEIKQGMANGGINNIEVEDLAGISLDNVTDDDVKAAQQQAKKAIEGNRKAAAIKQHIQEQLPESPSPQELVTAQAAMSVVDVVNMNTDDADDLNISAVEKVGVPLDTLDSNASIEEVEQLNEQVQKMIGIAFTKYEEDSNARKDIPDSVKSEAAATTIEETGKDAVPKMPAEVVEPDTQSSKENFDEPVPSNPLTESAIDTIISETNAQVNYKDIKGTWRSTTGRHPYGKSYGTYHENISDKDSVQYKRSKAIWEYLNKAGAFDRQDNSSTDRIKSGDTVHLMVKYMPEVFEKRIEEVSDEDKPYAMVILMLNDNNDNGDIIGDLPLAELEPSNKDNTQLKALQKKLFDAFFEYHKKEGGNEAIVDSTLHKEGIGNLNLQFKSKSPLLLKVAQVMHGTVPFRKNETNTLNDVAEGLPFEIGVYVATDDIAGTRIIATERKDPSKKKERGAGIRPPKVGSKGQPYLLLPTPAGDKIAVPFYMKPFDAVKHQNTMFYRILSNAFYELWANRECSTQAQVESFNKAKDVIQGLLQIKVQEGVKTVVSGKNAAMFNFQSLVNPDVKFTLYAPNIDNDVKGAISELLKQLSGTSINVSLQFTNKSIKAAGLKADYNTLIGEIADVNLPKGINHTVNSWFTVDLAPTAKVSSTPSPAIAKTVTDIVDGKNVNIDINKGVAFDPATGEKVKMTDAIALRIAQENAAKPVNEGKETIQVIIDGKTKTYNTKEGKFVRDTTSKERFDSTPAVEDNTPLEPEESTKPAVSHKTIKQIEEEVKQKKIVGRQNKNAWDAIPDDLKLKLVNEGQSLQLSFGKTTSIISYSDILSLSEALKAANMFAKAGSLKVTEGPKYRKADNQEYRKADIQKERRWLEKNLPMFNTEERLHLIQGLIKIPNSEEWAWGRFQAGVIALSSQASAGTLYHEAFHVVTQTLLNDEELSALYEAAVERYGESSPALLEELLAEDFRKYVQTEETPIIGYIKKIFRRIMHAIKNLSGYKDSIDTLFYNINNGKFKYSVPRVARGDNPFYRMAFKDGVNEDLYQYENPIAKKVIWSFRNNSSLKGEASRTGKSWTRFKKMWKAKGVSVIGGWSKHSTEVPRRVLKDIMLIENGEEISMDYVEDYYDFMKQRDYRIAVQNALEGKLEFLNWDRFTPEQQESLRLSGLSKESFENLSVEEREQKFKCET